MPILDRRNLLRASVAAALPSQTVSFFSGCQRSQELSSRGNSQDAGQTVNEPEDPWMQIHYLEIVTPDADKICTQYAKVHGLTFNDPDPNLGGARTAKFSGGGYLGVRGPLRETETPVVRPYVLVDDIESAVAAAADAGAEVALPPMALGGHGRCAIVIQGGIECGFWQL